jgi:hypothetical protein
MQHRIYPSQNLSRVNLTDFAKKFALQVEKNSAKKLFAENYIKVT